MSTCVSAPKDSVICDGLNFVLEFTGEEFGLHRMGLATCCGRGFESRK